MKSVEVRSQLVEALRLDLIGPDAVEKLGTPDEILPQSPSRWYLTGFLVPLDAGEEQRAQEGSDDDLDEMNEAGGADDKNTPEPAAARRAYMPSSIGMSILVPASARRLTVTVRWGDYHLQQTKEGQGGFGPWQRTPHEEQVVFDLPPEAKKPEEEDVPTSNGLRLALSVRPVNSDGAEGGLPVGTRSVSVFLVNRRRPAPDETRDEAFAFQAQIEVVSEEPLVPRPNLRSLGSSDWDERVGDLQYRDVCEFAVGHSVATEAVIEDCHCRLVRTCWIPEAEVERVAPADQRRRTVDGRPGATGQRRRRQGQARQLRRPVPRLDQPAAGQDAAVAGQAERNRRRTAAAGRDCRRPHRAGDRPAGRPKVPGGVQDRQPGDGRGGQAAVWGHAGQGSRPRSNPSGGPSSLRSS